jgi:hypothetical protein
MSLLEGPNPVSAERYATVPMSSSPNAIDHLTLGSPAKGLGPRFF